MRQAGLGRRGRGARGRPPGRGRPTAGLVRSRSARSSARERRFGRSPASVRAASRPLGLGRRRFKPVAQGQLLGHLRLARGVLEQLVKFRDALGDLAQPRSWPPGRLSAAVFASSRSRARARSASLNSAASCRDGRRPPLRLPAPRSALPPVLAPARRAHRARLAHPAARSASSTCGAPARPADRGPRAAPPGRRSCRPRACVLRLRGPVAFPRGRLRRRGSFAACVQLAPCLRRALTSVSARVKLIVVDSWRPQLGGRGAAAHGGSGQRSARGPLRCAGESAVQCGRGSRLSGRPRPWPPPVPAVRSASRALVTARSASARRACAVIDLVATSGAGAGSARSARTPGKAPPPPGADAARR